MAGFRARMPVTSLDGETQAEEPEIDPALAREEELAAARDESFQAGLEAGRTENLEAVELIIAECRALMQSLDEASTIHKAALGPMMKKAVRDLTDQIAEAQVAPDQALVQVVLATQLATFTESN